jgi:phospholipase C
MKLFHRALVVLFSTLLSTFTAAQIQPGMFSNIIIIVQENRTPDNLFGSYAGTTCGGTANFPGADIVNGGAPGNGTYTCNASYAMTQDTIRTTKTRIGRTTTMAGTWMAFAMPVSTRRLAHRIPMFNSLR